MKMADVTPGLVYAVPANRMGGPWSKAGYGNGTGVQVRDGQIAVPFKVDRVGKFRWKQSGACTKEIVDDGYTTTIVGSFPDLQKMLGNKRPENKFKSTGGWRRHRQGHHVAAPTWPGYPSGIGIASKKFVWREDEVILTPVDIVMPWADFLKRREEWVFVANEVDAYNVRLLELRKQVYGMMEPILEGHAAKARVPRGGMNMRVPSGQRMAYDHPMLTFERTFESQLTLNDLPVDVRRVLEPMLKEMAAIQKKLECAV